MDYSTIKILLDKYWEGETSISEESQLRDYFNQDEVEASLKGYKPMFVYIKEEQSAKISDDFEARLKAQLDAEEKAPVKIRSLRFYLPRIAAAAVFVFGVFFLYKNSGALEQQEDIVMEDTYEDPKEAYEKAKEVLLLLSQNLKNGTDKASSSMKKAEKATARIKR